MNFKETVKSNKWVWIAFLIYLTLGLILLLIGDKGHWVLWMADIRNPFLNFFFTYGTYMGDGWVIGALYLVYLIIRFRFWHYLFAATLIPVGITWILKFGVFSHSLRPMEYFSRQGIDISLVPGISVHNFNSFPSGHTTVAFAFFTGLLFIVKPLWLKLLLLFIAIIVGISRIYLTQHFLEDVIAGSLIGFVIPFMIYGMVSGKKWFNSAYKPGFLPNKWN